LSNVALASAFLTKCPTVAYFVPQITRLLAASRQVLINFLSSKQSYYFCIETYLFQEEALPEKERLSFALLQFPRKSCAKKLSLSPVVLKRVELRQISGVLPRRKKDL